MSLQNLAHHVQSAGRGDDKMLVHMTPKEVAGLQTLAAAHGGSLTINPETGLPEAGFLSSILPMIAGIALGPAGVGLTAMQAGLAAGALGTVATGSLQKGLLAGLGAYGGAGLGAGLAGIGPAAATSGLSAANTAALVAPGGTPFTMPSAANMVATPATAATLPTATGAAAGSPFGMAAPVNPAVTPQVTSMPPPAAPTNINVPGTDTLAGRVKTMGQNVGRLFSGKDEDAAYRKQFFKEYRPEMIASGISALSYQPELEEEKERRAKRFDPNYRAYSPGYFEPMYASSRAPGGSSERLFYAKEGGLMALAEGGPVAQMSGLNAIGANTHYPMADQMAPRYAASSEIPISENIIKPQGDANIDPYTGEQKFDAGGATGINAREQGYVLHDTGVSYTPYIGGTTSTGRTGGTGGTTQVKKEEVFMPEYNFRDPITGQYSYVQPEPEFTPFKKIPSLDSKNVRRVTRADVERIFNRYGVTPTEEQLTKAVGNRLSDKQIFDKYVKKSPDWSQKKTLTADEVNDYFQQVWGQNATPDEIAKFTRPNAKYNFAQLYEYAKKQPEYLENFNKVAQTAFTTGRTQEKETKLGEERAAMPLQTVDISSAFQDILGRPPSWEELQSFKQKPLVMADLKNQLQASKEYETKLTKPFVPAIEFDPYGRVGIEGLPAYKTPAEEAGLGSFYETMGKRLAQQGGYSPPPPAPPPMQDRILPPPAPITYQAPAGINQLPAGNTTPAPTPAPVPVPPQEGRVEIDALTGQPVRTMAEGGAAGGQYHLGDYSDGGRLLKGPGDGVSDSIPASINGRRPARLADGEFVIPARIVSELGNGSTEAGARQLYAMMDRIQSARRKSVGKGKVAVNSKASKLLPA